MKNKEFTDKELEDIIALNDAEKNMLKKQANDLLLSDKQVSVLQKYSIDASKCKTETELLYMIDNAMDGSDEDEYADLEALADTIAERNYYRNSRK